MKLKDLEPIQWFMLIVAWIGCTMFFSLLLSIETSLSLFLVGLFAGLISAIVTVQLTLVACLIGLLVFRSVKPRTPKQA